MSSVALFQRYFRCLVCNTERNSDNNLELNAKPRHTRWSVTLWVSSRVASQARKVTSQMTSHTRHRQLREKQITKQSNKREGSEWRHLHETINLWEGYRCWRSTKTNFCLLKEGIKDQEEMDAGKSRDWSVIVNCKSENVSTWVS